MIEDNVGLYRRFRLFLSKDLSRLFFYKPSRITRKGNLLRESLSG